MAKFAKAPLLFIWLAQVIKKSLNIAGFMLMQVIIVDFFNGLLLSSTWFILRDSRARSFLLL